MAKRDMVLRKVELERARLISMPEKQRIFFIYAGHISNELNWMQRRMLTLQTTGNDLKVGIGVKRTPEESALLDANATAVMILGRLFSGKLVEALKFLQEFCLEEVWFRKARLKLTPRGKDSLRRLRRYLLRERSRLDKSPLQLMRHKFGFHYDRKAAKQCVRPANLSDPFFLYLGENVGTSLYVGSEWTVMNTYVEFVSSGQHKRTIERWISHMLDVNGWVMDVCGETMAVLLDTYVAERFEDVKWEEIILKDLPSLRGLREYFFAKD